MATAGDLDRPRAAPWAAGAVAVLTLAWLCGALVLLWRVFGIGMEGYADHHSNSGARADEIAREGNQAASLLVLEVVAGPVVIAMLAGLWRLRWTAAVYVVIALVVGALVLPVAGDALRDATPPPPPPPPPTICQERSGGDTDCPGG